MKNLKMSIVVMLLLIFFFINVQEKEKKNYDYVIMKMDYSKMMNMNNDVKVEVILNDYFNLKDVLVVDDIKKVVQEGFKLVVLLKVFDVLKYIVEE